MNIKKYKLSKLVTSSVFAATALVSLLIPATASAGLVSGDAILTFDNDAVKASIPADYVFVKHWDAANNSIVIDGTGGTSVPVAGTTALTFAVNTNTSDIVHAANDRVERATTMDTSDTSVGQIGLSGALQLANGGSLFPKDFYIVKAAGTWNIQAPFTGFGDPTLFTLKNVSESITGSGELSLTGDIHWATAGYNWTAVTGGDGLIKLGTFSLNPVPVPAAVWLFGTGLVGLFASRRKNSVAA